MTEHASSLQRSLVFAFMALVTSYLLGCVLLEALVGQTGPGGSVVYGATAAVGLEFLISAWPSLWGDPQGER